MTDAILSTYPTYFATMVIQQDVILNHIVQIHEIHLSLQQTFCFTQFSIFSLFNIFSQVLKSRILIFVFTRTAKMILTVGTALMEMWLIRYGIMYDNRPNVWNYKSMIIDINNYNGTHSIVHSVQEWMMNQCTTELLLQTRTITRMNEQSVARMNNNNTSSSSNN